MRGMLIVFEGLDKAGKTTQIEILSKKLTEKKIQNVIFRFPSRKTEVGKLIDKYLKGEIILSNEVAQLLFVANRFELINDIESFLISGVYVIFDRSYISGIAYGMAGGLEREFLESINYGQLKSDILFYLNLNPEESIKRTQTLKNEEIFENFEFQKKVYDNYNLLKKENWIDIDATKNNIETISKIIYKEIATIINKNIIDLSQNIQRVTN